MQVQFSASSRVSRRQQLLEGPICVSVNHNGVRDLADLLDISLAVVITVLNAYSGFALVAEGFMLDNPLLTTVGSLIGVSGSILSYIMVCILSCLHSNLVVLTSLQCVAMNRSLTNVLFGGIGTIAPSEATKIEGTITKTTVDDTVEALANADSVILVSGSHHSPSQSHLLSLGCWVRHGRGQGSIRYLRNLLNAPRKRHQCALCHSPSGGSHAWSMQCASGGGFGAI